MFGSGSVTLFRVRGIPVRAHWTLLIVLPYLALVFAMRFVEVADLAGVRPEAVVLPPLVWGGLVAVALFASVALHELAHSLVAVAYGGRVREITLMLLGGVSQLERISRRPWTEALVSFVGPATSLALAGFLALVHQLVPRGPADLDLALFYLAQVNLVLGLFNLLPSFPMDGGRVLRALLTGPLGRPRATAIAAGIGKVGAILLGALGIWGGNLLLLLIAVFLFSGADAEERAERLHSALGGLRVEDLPVAHVPTVGLGDSLAAALADMHDAGRLDAVALGPLGEPVGVVRAVDAIESAPDVRADRTVRDLGPRLMRAVAVVSAKETASDALDRAAAEGAEYLMVVELSEATGPVLVGLLGRVEIEAALALRAAELRATARRPGPHPRPREA